MAAVDRSHNGTEAARRQGLLVRSSSAPARVSALARPSVLLGPYAPRDDRSFATRRWASLTWRLSLLLFLIPLALVGATLAYQLFTDDPLLIQITDSATGDPLPGVEVTVGEKRLVADAQGQVEIDADDATALISVQHPGYAPLAQAPAAVGDGDRVIALRPSTVTGRLTDAASGNPLAGVAVSFMTEAGPGPAVATGADGSFVLTDVPENARIRIDASDYGVIEEPLNHRPRYDKALTLSVIKGIITDLNGAPVAGALVSSLDGARSTVTAADGSYRLTGADDLAEVRARSPGYLDQTASVPDTKQVSMTLEPEMIKAVYANVGTLAEPGRLQALIEIADTTEVNAIVIDVKQDTIYYDTQVPFFRDLEGMVTPIFDPAELLATLDEHNIYSIARMVVFKDPVVAEQRPDLAVRDEVTDGLWRDMNDAAWVNAFNEELWTSNAELGFELAQLGFDEVQYDYIRFPSDGDLRTADFGSDYSEGARRAAIAGAVKVGQEAVHAGGARFAIDLFPIIAIYGDDQGIGQTLQDLTPLADYVNLMIYPSHYTEGNIPVDGHPNDFPAETVAYTLEKADELVPGTRLKMRPWLQDFTYPFEGFSEYGPGEVRAQIDATEEYGASGWMLWNAAGQFAVEALAPDS